MLFTSFTSQTTSVSFPFLSFLFKYFKDFSFNAGVCKYFLQLFHKSFFTIYWTQANNMEWPISTFTLVHCLYICSTLVPQANCLGKWFNNTFTCKCFYSTHKETVEMDWVGMYCMLIGQPQCLLYYLYGHIPRVKKKYFYHKLQNDSMSASMLRFSILWVNKMLSEDTHT